MTEQQLEEALDLAAELVDTLRQIGVVDDNIRHDQFKKPFVGLTNHPAFQEADKRRMQKFWDAVDRAAARVDSWPEWKKGIRVSSR